MNIITYFMNALGSLYQYAFPPLTQSSYDERFNQSNEDKKRRSDNYYKRKEDFEFLSKKNGVFLPMMGIPQKDPLLDTTGSCSVPTTGWFSKLFGSRRPTPTKSLREQLRKNSIQSYIDRHKKSIQS